MTSADIPTGIKYIDQGWAWVILAASSALMTLVQGNVRSFGIFVVELEKEYGSSAAVVSSILSAQAISCSISSLLVLNCLLKTLPLRLIVIMGCLLSAICFILDWQATEIELVTIFHVLNGMGLAFTYGPTMVLVGHYFIKYRGTAYALTSCGSSVGQFALSPLISFLITEYGVKGALLLNSSIFFQCITFAMLLRPTSFFHPKPKKKKETDEGEEEEDNLYTEAVSESLNTERTCMVDIQEESEDEYYEEELETPKGNSTATEKHLEAILGSNQIERISINELNSLQDITNINGKAEVSEDLKNEVMDLSYDSYSSEKKVTKHVRRFGEFFVSECGTLWKNVDFNLFKSPIFLTYFFGTSLGQLASYTPQAFFPSHAKDMGLGRKEGMLFVAIAGFADIGGRILTTLVVDRKCLNRPRFLGCVLIAHGIVACFIPLFHNFLTFAAYCVLYGTCGGIIFAISNTILTDYIGVDRLSQGLGLMLFFNGIATAGAFLLIGFFREITGSYNPGFVANGLSLVVSGILFCVEVCIKYERQPRG